MKTNQNANAGEQAERRKFYAEVFYSSGEVFDFGPIWATDKNAVVAQIRPRGKVKSITICEVAHSHACLTSDMWWTVAPRTGPKEPVPVRQQTRHSPGPWTYWPQKEIVECWWGIGKSPKYVPYARIVGDGEGNEANARLVAAAPELLAACELALSRAECELRMWPVKDEDSVEHQSLIAAALKMRAAINKATDA